MRQASRVTAPILPSRVAWPTIRASGSAPSLTCFNTPSRVKGFTGQSDAQWARSEGGRQAAAALGEQSAVLAAATVTLCCHGTRGGASSRRSTGRGGASCGLLGCTLATPQRRRGPPPASANGDAGGRSQDPESLVFCFDFDGVVCDSVNESSVAAWLHARKRWPTLEFGNSPEPFLEPMRQMRPVVETGWENTVLIRLLSEAGLVAATKASKAPQAPDKNDPNALPVAGMAGIAPLPGQKRFTAAYTDEFSPTNVLVAGVLEDWDELRTGHVQELGLDIDELIREFGEVRDRWIAKNKEDWLSRNQPYEGVPDCMQAMLDEGAEVFVITTKQRRFCAALLEDFGLELPDGNLFALEDGPKIGVLKSLLAREDLAGRTFHFIEDKLSTLRRVSEDEALSSIQLHLVDWGYNTPKDRKLAGSSVLGQVSMLSSGELESLGIGRPWL